METKVCRVCGVEKDIGEFHWLNRAKGYRSYQCKPCNRIATRAYYHSHPKTRAKVAARAKEWAKRNPDKIKTIGRASSMKSKYGLTETDYQALLASQGGGCAICKSADSGRTAHKWADGRFHVDHCHATGRVRGLLCHGCNVRLGGYERLLRDRPYEWLQAYLTG